MADQKFQGMTPALRQNILEFFADPNANYAAKRDKEKWRATLTALEAIKAVPVEAEAAHGEK
jgi:hypothetical protein